MTHPYIWLVYFCVVALFTANGEECTDDAIDKCMYYDDNQNSTIRDAHTEDCRRHKEGFTKCVKPFISNCTDDGPRFYKTYIVVHDRFFNYVCGEAFETYVNTFECLQKTVSDLQCQAYLTVTENNGRTELEELTRYTEEECRALKQDLLCTKEFDKKACGEDAANVHDTISRIYLHEFGKVRGCYLPDPLPDGNTGSTSRVCCDTGSMLWWVISMACLMITII